MLSFKEVHGSIRIPLAIVEEIVCDVLHAAGAANEKTSNCAKTLSAVRNSLARTCSGRRGAEINAGRKMLTVLQLEKKLSHCPGHSLNFDQPNRRFGPDEDAGLVNQELKVRFIALWKDRRFSRRSRSRRRAARSAALRTVVRSAGLN